MGSEHEVGMLREPAVNPNGALVLGRGAHLVELKPRRIAFRVADLALAEEQDVDDDIRAGTGAEAPFGQPDRGNQIGRLRDVLARATLGLVHRA